MNDNPDSTVLELLALIEKQSAKFAEAVEQLEAATALVGRLQAQLSEYAWERTHSDVLSKTPACVAPLNGWN